MASGSRSEKMSMVSMQSRFFSEREVPGRRIVSVRFLWKSEKVRRVFNWLPPRSAAEVRCEAWRETARAQDFRATRPCRSARMWVRQRRAEEYADPAGRDG